MILSRFLQVFSILFLTLWIDPIDSCTCIENIDLQQSFFESDHIFIGEAIEVRKRDDFMVDVTFEVKENFKGNVSANGQIKITSCIMESMCCLIIQPNELWQIWSEHSKDTPNELFANLCSASTRDLTKNINFLRNSFILDSSSTHHLSSSLWTYATILFIILFRT